MSKITVGLFYISLFHGKRRTNGKQIYGFILVRDKLNVGYDYWLFMWGSYHKRLYKR